MITLSTPHVPLGLALSDALLILQRSGTPTQEDSNGERCYRIETSLFAMAVYPKDEIVGAIWYDDPSGRESDATRVEKIEAYLTRYGHPTNWELRLDNGWMHYWFNPTDGVQMIYGVHKDVIRFNQYSENA